MAATKAFRAPFIESIMMYETLSETDYSPSHQCTFSPNIFVDITQHMNKKMDILACYDTEFHAPPFPRSLDAVKALATYRGASAYMEKAEAFMLIKQRS
jgi:LmbE family N-acetylglucosaminyl deacetylase